MTKVPASLLFVCGENALRSPMAEAMVKKWYGDRVYVDSVGVSAGRLNPFAVVVMDEIGIDIRSHRSKSIDGLRDTSFEMIVALSPEAHQAAMEIARMNAVEVIHWPIYDPSLVEGNRESRLAAFREVRDTLQVLIEDLFGNPDRDPT